MLSIASYWCLQIDTTGPSPRGRDKGSRDPASSLESSKEAVDNESLYVTCKKYARCGQAYECNLVSGRRRPRLFTVGVLCPWSLAQ